MQWPTMARRGKFDDIGVVLIASGSTKLVKICSARARARARAHCRFFLTTNFADPDAVKTSPIWLEVEPEARARTLRSEV